MTLPGTSTSFSQARIDGQPVRIALIDVARGVALVAMGVFHFAWDLSFLKFIATDIALDPVWRMFSHSIAGSFLALAGLSLALAHVFGFRSQPFWRRFAVIAGAALAVSAATWFAMPQSYVLFGILHCIALGSLLCILLINAPWWLSLVGAAVVAGLPSLFQVPALAPVQEWFDNSLLFTIWQHAGLSDVPPVTVDFVPLFPWAAFMLAGFGAGLLLARSGLVGGLSAVNLPPVAKPLIWAGRHSLPIYLIHQPVLIGALMAVAYFAPGLTVNLEQQAEDNFRRDCITECRVSRSRETCLSACSCVIEDLRRDPVLLRRAIGTSRTDQNTDAALAASANMCFRRSQTP